MNPLRIALVGLGNVGQAFVSFLETARPEPAIQIAAVSDSSGGFILDPPYDPAAIINQKRAGNSLKQILPGLVAHPGAEFIRALPAAGVSLLLECLPTALADGEPGLGLIRTALDLGIDVVTVDKGPLVHGFAHLAPAARLERPTASPGLGYAGTVGVPAPDDLASDRVLEIRGILNGTTNYILSEMAGRSISFEQALAAAQATGIAEPDPSFDLDGWDTAVKILILARSLMGADVRLPDVSRIGIGPEMQHLMSAARDSGRKVKLIGRARIWQGRVRVSVAPKLVAADSPFYSIDGPAKAAIFRTKAGERLVHARSGQHAISETILEDILRVANRNR